MGTWKTPLQRGLIGGSMASIISTAALAAGRQITFAAWVFCRTASRVSLKIVDDGTTTTDDYILEQQKGITIFSAAVRRPSSSASRAARRKSAMISFASRRVALSRRFSSAATAA